MTAMIAATKRTERGPPLRKHEISALIKHHRFGKVGLERPKLHEFGRICRSIGATYKPVEPSCCDPHRSLQKLGPFERSWSGPTLTERTHFRDSVRFETIFFFARIEQPRRRNVFRIGPLAFVKERPHRLAAITSAARFAARRA